MNPRLLLHPAEGAFTGSLSRIPAFSLCSGDSKDYARKGGSTLSPLPCPGVYVCVAGGADYRPEVQGQHPPTGAVLPSLQALLTLLETQR